MSSTLPRLPERIVATLPTKSVGTRTSIARVGSKTAVPAVNKASHTCTYLMQDLIETNLCVLYPREEQSV